MASGVSFILHCKIEKVLIGQWYGDLALYFAECATDLQ